MVANGLFRSTLPYPAQFQVMTSIWPMRKDIKQKAKRQHRQKPNEFLQ